MNQFENEKIIDLIYKIFIFFVIISLYLLILDLILPILINEFNSNIVGKVTFREIHYTDSDYGYINDFITLIYLLVGLSMNLLISIFDLNLNLILTIVSLSFITILILIFPIIFILFIHKLKS